MAKKALAALCAAGLSIAAGPPPSPAQSHDNSSNSQRLAEVKAFAKKVDSLAWVHGPAVVQIGDEATIRLPRGDRYLDPTRRANFCS